MTYWRTKRDNESVLVRGSEQLEVVAQDIGIDSGEYEEKVVKVRRNNAKGIHQKKKKEWFDVGIGEEKSF